MLNAILLKHAILMQMNVSFQMVEHDDKSSLQIQQQPNNYYKNVSENKEISKLVSLLSTSINSTKKVWVLVFCRTRAVVVVGELGGGPQRSYFVLRFCPFSQPASTPPRRSDHSLAIVARRNPGVGDPRDLTLS